VKTASSQRSGWIGPCLWVALLVPWPWVGALADASGGAATRLPQDVSQFVQRREACDHFRGEEPYDAARRADLAQKLRQLCTGTDLQLRALKQKYRNRPSVMSKLGDYDPAIE
jgi:hypothetical protein